MTPVPTMGSTVSGWIEAEREVPGDHEGEVPGDHEEGKRTFRDFVEEGII